MNKRKFLASLFAMLPAAFLINKANHGPERGSVFFQKTCKHKIGNYKLECRNGRIEIVSEFNENAVDELISKNPDVVINALAKRRAIST